MQKTQQPPLEARIIKEAIVSSQPLPVRGVLRLSFMGQQVLVVYTVEKSNTGSHS